MRRPASDFGGPTSQAPLMYRTLRSTRTVEPSTPRSRRRSAVASPNRSPPKASTKINTRYRVGTAPASACTSDAVNDRDGLAGFGAPAERSRHGFISITPSRTATFKIARSSRYACASAVDPVVFSACSCHWRTRVGLASATATSCHVPARCSRHRPAYNALVLSRRSPRAR